MRRSPEARIAGRYTAGPERSFYGRRQGRKLTPARRALYERHLPRLRFAVPETGRLDPRTLFPAPPEQVWLEIGFGAGEHLAGQARAHPEIGFLGSEPFVNGVAGLLVTVVREGLSNIRVLPDDARPLLARLAPASLGRLFLLFPDPWPKARHARRRFVQQATLDAIAAALADGAEFRVASDDPGYIAWTLAQVLRHPAFAWDARRAQDWRVRPSDWPETRYEAKARAEGRGPVFLRFRRRPRDGPPPQPA